MMYPFMTLNDGTEIVHSELKKDGTVKVYVEKPVYRGFQSAECYLPEYTWKNIHGFSKKDIEYYQDYIKSISHVIMELAADGGFEKDAANF